MRKKRCIRTLGRMSVICVLAAVLTVGLAAAASEIQDNQDKMEDVQDNIDRIEAERQEMLTRLEELKEKRLDAEAYIAELGREIDGVMAEVAVMTEEKFAVMQQIEEISAELVNAEAQAADQYEKMKLRIQYMYERGETEYLDLVLSSQSLTDFLSRVEYISQISEYDRAMLITYRETIEEVSAAKELLLERKAKLEAWEAELAAKEAALVVLAEEKQSELDALEGEIDHTDHLIIDYDQALKEEEAQLLEIQREIERQEEEERKRQEEERRRQEEEERRRQEEEEKRRQEEEEQKRQEEENKNNSTAGGDSTSGEDNSAGGNGSDTNQDSNDTSQSGGGTNQGSSGTGDLSSDQQVSAKGMIWPVASCTRITSQFGYRVDPITGEVDGTLSNHKGIDIALPGGALAGAPVSAAAGGTVVIARYSSSAGNWVIIYHGNSTYTVYMHLQELRVSAGQTVSRGQTIGLVGTTGWSTGPHLHFEVRIGGFVDSSYSVDPLLYVEP